MKFYINTPNSSGMEFRTKEDLLKEIGLMVDDCIANGGTFMELLVQADASCYYIDEEEEDEEWSDEDEAYWETYEGEEEK